MNDELKSESAPQDASSHRLVIVSLAAALATCAIAAFHPSGVKPRVIQHKTMHADILPTLLSIMGVPVTQPESFDGVDLTSVDVETFD
jgi:hypothetical protein